ncbi:unnamed protein product [Sphagnum jensenii]
MNHFYCTGAFEVRAQIAASGQANGVSTGGPYTSTIRVRPIFGVRMSSTWWAVVYDQSTVLGLRGSAEPSTIEYSLSLPPCIWLRKVHAVRKLLLC